MNLGCSLCIAGALSLQTPASFFHELCYFLEEGETCQNVGSLLRCVQCFWGRIFTSATPSVTNQEWLTDGSTELYQCCCTELQSKEEYLFPKIFLSLQSLEICWCVWHCIVLSGWNSWCFVYFSTKHNIHSTPHAWFHKCELFSLWHWAVITHKMLAPVCLQMKSPSCVRLIIFQALVYTLKMCLTGLHFLVLCLKMFFSDDQVT